jgi:hypothetical protein
VQKGAMKNTTATHLAEGQLSIKSGLILNKKYAQLSGNLLSLVPYKEEAKQKSTADPAAKQEDRRKDVFDVTLVQVTEEGDNRFTLNGPKLAKPLSFKAPSKVNCQEWVEVFRKFRGSDTVSDVRTPRSDVPSPSSSLSSVSDGVTSSVHFDSAAMVCPPQKEVPRPGSWPCNKCGSWNLRLAKECTTCKGEGTFRQAKSTGCLIGTGKGRLASATSRGIPLTHSASGAATQHHHVGPVDRSVRAFEDEVHACGILLNTTSSIESKELELDKMNSSQDSGSIADDRAATDLSTLT